MWTVAVASLIDSSLNGPVHPPFSRYIMTLSFGDSWSVGVTLGLFRIASAFFT